MTEPMSEPVAVTLEQLREMAHENPDAFTLTNGDVLDIVGAALAAPPAPERRSTPEEQASAIAHGHALDAEDGGYPAPESRVPAALRGALIDAKLARLNWQKYNGEQGGEIVYQAEKMATAIDCILATFDQAVPSGVDGLEAKLRFMARHERKDGSKRDAETLDAAADAIAAHGMVLCEACPPVDYPTDKTRCSPCPRRVVQPDGAVLAALSPVPASETVEAIIERVARALAEVDIRQKRRHDTKPADLERILPDAIDYCWRDYEAPAQAAIRALKDGQ